MGLTAAAKSLSIGLKHALYASSFTSSIADGRLAPGTKQTEPRAHSSGDYNARVPKISM